MANPTKPQANVEAPHDKLSCLAAQIVDQAIRNLALDNEFAPGRLARRILRMERDKAEPEKYKADYEVLARAILESQEGTAGTIDPKSKLIEFPIKAKAKRAIERHMKRLARQR